MATLHTRTVEVETLEDFDALVRRGARTMRGWRVQDVDLTDRTSALLELTAAGALFLGCDLQAPATEHLRTQGALVFPDIPEVPFDAYRSQLYAPEELYEGVQTASYRHTPDARIYAWSRSADRAVARKLASALHDHAIDEALRESLQGRAVVGVMGGHAVSRGDDDYVAACRLGRALARGELLVATGGGPGAMEAANLGAYLAAHGDGAIEQASDVLAAAPAFRPSVTQWVRAAFEVRRRWPQGGDSVGIPTWFYGHEPPNAFASSIAKYFQNALREETLLHHCDAGIVFLPGAGGTVQEIFQDACENYYADEATVAPMVLVGRAYWTEQVPAWPLLSALAAGRPMEGRVHLVDSVEDAVAVLTG